MHSAWIGEHHFNSLGVLSCPDIVLSYIASRTRNIRLAPAVTVLPLHHPIHVAEQWATLDLLSRGRVDFAVGRGYDRREYAPFHVSFEDNQSIFEEGLELVRALWAADGRISYLGKHYDFEDVRITPKPVQQPIPTYVGSFSKPSIELAARLGCGLIVAPFAAAITFGGLQRVADLYHEACARHGTAPGRLMCSYFTHFADTQEQENAQRAPNTLLQGMRYSGLALRSQNCPAKLSIFRPHGRPAQERETRGSDGEFRPSGFARRHHRNPQEGRSGGLF
jgi:alkanesulfonate monooxygenase SsuD/methylene tetrahydromethanopterin reductase-like flavin-dependent oxidoreductase (luciferase family)